MFARMTLGQKITAGFGMLLAIMAVVGSMAIWFMRDASHESSTLANEYAPEVEMTTMSLDHLMETNLAARTYALTEDKKAKAHAEAGIAKLHDDAKKLLEHSDKSEHLVLLKAEAPTFVALVKEYDNSFKKSAEILDQVAGDRTQLNEAAAKVVANFNDFAEMNDKYLSKLVEDKADIGIAKNAILSQHGIAECRNLTNQIRIATWRGQAARDVSVVEAAMTQFDALEKRLASVRSLNTEASALKNLDGIKDALNGYKQGMIELCNNWKALIAASKERGEIGEKMSAEALKIAAGGAKGISKRSLESEQSLNRAVNQMGMGLGIAAVFGILSALFITRSIVNTINAIISGLNSSSNQVSSAANQVAQAGQQLASGASEQASSLEETSASLEEMASMTRQNADNALQANSMASEASKAAEKGREAMTRMSDAIGKIKTSSDETAKILKTIDEIAFQTNLLALNAAVEAARAGDAGKGFAVVAEEVRNLAQRSAEAAKSTARLIEDSQKNSDNGVEVSREVGETLQQIAQSVTKLQQLNGEVSSASQEQSKGIDQVNIAISQMDKVTQSNAANAEESASASEELSMQAQELAGLVGQLRTMVGGSSQGPSEAASPANFNPAQAKKIVRFDTEKAVNPGKKMVAKLKNVSAAEKVIPLTGDDMSDF